MISPRGARGIPARSLNRTATVTVGRLGIPVPGVYMLRVHGRRTGELRSTPLYVLKERGSRYLVAPRGETDWSHNLRAAGWGELVRGKRVERVRAVEVFGFERKRIIKAYAKRHRLMTARFFDLPPKEDEEAWRREAAKHPVFRLASGDAATL